METRTYRTVNGMIFYTEGDAAVSPKQPEPVGAPPTDDEPADRIPISGVRDELPTVPEGVGTTFRAPIAVRQEQPVTAPAPAREQVAFDRADAVPILGRPTKEPVTVESPVGGAFRLPVGQVHESEPTAVAPGPPAPTDVTRIPSGPVPPIDEPPLPLVPLDTGTTVTVQTGQVPDDKVTRRVPKEGDK
jgi:hypothetical protein